MRARPLSRIRQLITLCMLAAAVVTIGLAIAGALTGARSPAPELAHRNDERLPPLANSPLIRTILDSPIRLATLKSCAPKQHPTIQALTLFAL